MAAAIPDQLLKDFRNGHLVVTTYLERAEFLAELFAADGIHVSLEAVHR
jgi:hypothetical protein